MTGIPDADGTNSPLQTGPAVRGNWSSGRSRCRREKEPIPAMAGGYAQRGRMRRGVSQGLPGGVHGRESTLRTMGSKVDSGSDG